VPTKKKSCELVQQGVAGPAPDQILDAIRAEYWLPQDSRQKPQASKSETDTREHRAKYTEDQPTGEVMTALVHHALRLRDLANKIPYSASALLARAAIATIFWRAASTKLANFDLTIALFQDEYLKNLPFLPAAPMAYLATAVELAMPALIAVGLMTRLATLPLIGMALFIQLFVYPTSWPDHLIWITLLVLLLARGPGALSLDALLARQFDRNGAAMRAGA
jgi:putative oxidoreductase